MSFLGKLFGSHSSSSSNDVKGGAELETQLSELEVQAERAPLGFQGRPLNRAGDLCLQFGDRDRALGYYGRAIDSLLDDFQPGGARGVANKIIRVHPAAVRTLCTLTWLDLSARLVTAAVQDVGLYAEAALTAGREEMAVPEIVKMATFVASEEFLIAAAEALEHLEAADDAKQVRKWAKEGSSKEALHDSDELAEACVRAAIGANRRRNADGRVV